MSRQRCNASWPNAERQLYIRSDNGPEFVATVVKDWLQKAGINTLYIEPGAPWQNAYSESFNSRFRDEFLNLELFGNQLEAKVLGKEHQQKYNHQRPHSAPGNLTPVEFAARCRGANGGCPTETR